MHRSWSLALLTIVRVHELVGSMQSPAAVSEFSSSWHDHSIVGFEPTDGEGLPVYIWLAGTGIGWHNRSTDRDLLSRMAALGAVAGQCAYRNWIYPLDGCKGLVSKAGPIFDSSDVQSCLSRLCSRPKSNCTRGVAVHGFSQGAQLVSLAKYFAPEVSAALVQGHGDDAVSDLSECMDYRNASGQRNPLRGLRREQMRSLVGEHDSTFGCCFERPDSSCCRKKRTAREQQTNTTGYACAPGQRNCLQADGSGWYVVSDGDARKREGANHCFAWEGDCPVLAGAHDEWNPAYKWHTYEWCLDNNLQWLHSAALRFASGAIDR